MVAMSAFIASGAGDPVMPDDFDAEHARKWDEVLALLRARGAPIGEYGDVVRIYVLSFVEAKRARAHVAEHGAIVPAPRTGIPTHNPYRKVAQEAELQVARLADVLGMTPTSRAKVSRARCFIRVVWMVNSERCGLATLTARSTPRARLLNPGTASERLDRCHLSGRHDGEAAIDDRAQRGRSGAAWCHPEIRTRTLRACAGGASLHPLSPRSDDRRRHDWRREFGERQGPDGQGACAHGGGRGGPARRVAVAPGRGGGGMGASACRAAHAHPCTTCKGCTRDARSAHLGRGLGGSDNGGS